MTVQTDANQNHAPGFIEEQSAFLTALAEHGIPTDVQELLLAGDGRGGIAPGALRMALAAVMARPRTPVGERGALKEACAAMEYWAGCEEGVAHDVASSEIMSAGGAWPATAYEKARHVLSLPANGDAPFQSRVQPWLLACFGETIAADRQERNHRFLEESLELVQAAGCTASEAHQLVDYVFGRDVGEPAQEVGGVMVTLAALCLANGLDMHEAGEVEIARIWTKVEAIRAKQAAKPKHSPLPMAAAPAVPEIDNPARWFFTFAEDAEWWYLGGATYEAALEKAEREREDQPIYLQQAKRLVPKLREVALADNVIDAIADDECWREDGWEGQGDTPELQRRLDDAVGRWFAECCDLTGAQLDFIGECKVIPAKGGPAA